MKNKKWKQFGKLTEQCYRNMIGAEKDSSCWEKAFELLMEIVREERQKEPNCFQEVYMLDEATDYKYDISEFFHQRYICKNMDYSSRIHGYHNPAGDGTSNRPAFYVHILQSFYPKNPLDCQHSGRLLPAYFR